MNMSRNGAAASDGSGIDLQLVLQHVKRKRFELEQIEEEIQGSCVLAMDFRPRPSRASPWDPIGN